ncbi:MAG: LPXTG cell wall anchor domain-containing protein [Parasporobacterium sp.]|nr:LPXTG cell wall anchor domain-containing protein [Parasporobacterium sp.]
MKKISSILLSVFLIICLAVPVIAEDYESTTKSEVVFTENQKLESTFHNDQIDDMINEFMEPGDTATFTINLRNDNKETADFWMDRRTIESLEVWGGNPLMTGGGYSYELSYVGPGGERLLFSTMNIDGENFNHGVTPDIITKKIDRESYVYLDTYATGQGGQLILKISLDGESQGNDYQDTGANLAISFAVEIPQKDNPAKTGDTNRLLPYFIAMFAAGLVILAVAIFMVVKRKKDKKEGTS